ncbi:MAG: hypothetical protein DIZ80_15720 [endosymbiont of Galathealinum brachiosum]|uniref:GGDEF domain-containing protein n=1 Tax=endosymbiont of Galathealinum brachiosum TaxID=2200906 RepID=A0A370D9D5_9GAMM|nr:MAG: hypothetical protein DIZ80_15720 [endosymbiont of Galathealinum brachiosum]
MKPEKTNYSFSFKDYALAIMVLIGLNCGFIAISIWMSQQDIQSKFAQRTQTIHNTLLNRLNNIDVALISLVGLNHISADNKHDDVSKFSTDILNSFDFVDAIYISNKSTPDKQTAELHKNSYIINTVEPYTESTSKLIGIDFNTNDRYSSEISKAISLGTIVNTKPDNKLFKSDSHYYLLKSIYSGYFKPAAESSRINQAVSLAIIQINVKKLIPDFVTFYGEFNIAITEKKSGFISVESKKEIDIPFWHTDPLRFSALLKIHDSNFELNISKFLSIDEFINKKLYTASILSFSISLVFILLLHSLRNSQYKQTISQEKLFDQQEKARITLTSIGDAVISTDIHGRIEFINNAAEQLLGYTLNEVYGKEFSQTFILVDEIDPNSIKKPVEYCLNNPATGTLSETAMLLHHNGTPISINTNAASIHNSSNQLTGVVLVLRDISKERKLVRKIAYQATHDELTGLTNRRGFETQLQYAIDDRRSDTSKYSFCYIDLDEFKVVNDTCGHTAGDELLKLISSKIKKHIRKDDVLARLGGDEFGILLTNCDIKVAEKIANSIREEVKKTQFVWESKLFTVGASIGLVFIDKHTESITDVLSAADSACYIAKENGRDCVHIYTPDDKAIAEHIGLMQWPTRIRSALQDQNFVLYKQLIVPTNPDTTKPITEFLIRLKSDDGDLVPPMAFIPAAERYNLMHEIDCWVIKHAINEIEYLANANMLYSINLSGQSLGKANLYEYIANNITHTGINPNQLCFEITETAAITNQEAALTLITQLKKLGCSFALDDFGTGLSSFSYLKTLPVDILKIDGVFIRNMVTDKIDQSLVKTINQIGHELKLKTIAEWIETEESKTLLTDMGVDYLQGYYIEEPVIASVFL